MIQKHFMHAVANNPWFWIIFSSRYVYNINQAGLIRSWKTKCGPVLSNRIDSKPIATDSRHLLGHCGMDCCGLPCQQTYMIWSTQYAVSSSNHWLYDIIEATLRYHNYQNKRALFYIYILYFGNSSLQSMFLEVEYIFYHREGNLFSV